MPLRPKTDLQLIKFDWKRDKSTNSSIPTRMAMCPLRKSARVSRRVWDFLQMTKSPATPGSSMRSTLLGRRISQNIWLRRTLKKSSPQETRQTRNPCSPRHNQKQKKSTILWIPIKAGIFPSKSSKTKSNPAWKSGSKRPRTLKNLYRIKSASFTINTSSQTKRIPKDSLRRTFLILCWAGLKTARRRFRNQLQMPRKQLEMLRKLPAMPLRMLLIAFLTRQRMPRRR